MPKKRIDFISLTPKIIYQPQYHRNQNADEYACRQRKVEAEILFLDAYVAREFAQERNLVEEHQPRAEQRDDHANYEEIFSYAFHQLLGESVLAPMLETHIN
jgi:hypothetical protein